MFLIQILVPITLAVCGIALLLIDSNNKKIFLGNNSIENLSQVKFWKIDSKYSEFRKSLVGKVESHPDKSNIKFRLNELGLDQEHSYGEFRYQQLATTCISALLPFLLLFLMKISLLGAVLLSFTIAIMVYFYYDHLLTSKVNKHRANIESEFPAMIEMLTLAIAAGESPLSAFARISERSDSTLAKEFAKVVSDVRAGQPFHEALDRMGRALHSNVIRRFIDALVMTMVRGAPVVDVLFRHVAEARINQRNLVMDKAGKAETTMMIPIVFLILPISVVFALWPSINQLSFFAS